MSKLPRVTGEQAVKAFTRAGFALDHIKGGHHILKRDSVTLTIPVHKGKIVGLGLLLSQIKAAGLTKDQFRGLL